MAGASMETAPLMFGKPSGRIKGGLMLLISVLGILFFMLYACPRLESVLGLKSVARFIDDRNIESNMYFYTEVEAFSEASLNMDNTRAFPPQGPRPTAP